MKIPDRKAQLNRRVACSAFVARKFVNQLSAIMEYTLARGAGDANPKYPIEFEWLRMFSTQDLRSFATEFAEAVRGVTFEKQPIANIEILIEHWRKSALVISDEALSARLKGELAQTLLHRAPLPPAVARSAARRC